MSYVENVLNQMTVCPKCQGVGFNPKPCSECNGAGVFYVKPEVIYLFSLPTFLDSKRRRQISLIKKTFAVSLVIFILIIFIFLNNR